MIRVMIVDDHDVVREGLRQILSETSDIEVTAEAATGNDALDLLRKGGIDVMILDLNLPDRSGLDVLQQVRASAPRVRVVVLSMNPEESFAARALRAGASAYIGKRAARQDLADAVRAAAGGRRFLTDKAAQSVALQALDAGERLPHELLTDREFEVFQLIAAGRPPREIASQLSMSVKTVATHRAHIFEKFGASSNAELAQYAVRHKLIG